MPIITVTGLPNPEEAAERVQLVGLHSSIKKRVTAVEGLGVTKHDITIYFPADYLPEFHDGNEIIVIVTGLFEKPNRTPEVLHELCEALRDSILDYFRDANLIEVFVHPFKKGPGTFLSHQRNVPS